ncbi:hypothetical protein WA577_007505 [Blastocystis sp. JDR]
MELDVMSRLKHDAIIRNYGYNIHKDPEDPSKEIIAFIMEKADSDLEHKIGSLQSDGVPREDRNKVPLKYRKTYILQIAIGLMYMYKMGVYHADLKIDNILMVNGNCKIADFGLSKIMENKADLTVSRIGDIGNILHRAPELYDVETKDRIDPEEMRRILIHADVFAFGVLISEILTGCSECKMYKGDKEKVLNSATWGGNIESGYRLRPNEALKKDMEIYGIVNDCLKDEKDRPRIDKVYQRLRVWYDHDTPEI